VKYFLERTTPLGSIARVHRQKQLKKKYVEWENKGGGGPMPNFGKQQTVIEYIKKYSPNVFIETGTYKGKMVYAVMPYVKKIYTIELSEKHYQKAKRKFYGYPDINVLNGQSGEVLPQVMKDINEPCLFWLDAHYSGGSTAKGDLDTPIMQELDCVLHHSYAKKHVILIDDARCFVGENDYPEIKAFEEYIKKDFPDWIFKVEHDIIRIHAV
jgi:hypothetical protein